MKANKSVSGGGIVLCVIHNRRYATLVVSIMYCFIRAGTRRWWSAVSCSPTPRSTPYVRPWPLCACACVYERRWPGVPVPVPVPPVHVGACRCPASPSVPQHTRAYSLTVERVCAYIHDGRAYKSMHNKDICRVSVLFSALYAKCPYFPVLYMQSG